MLHSLSFLPELSNAMAFAENHARASDKHDICRHVLGGLPFCMYDGCVKRLPLHPSHATISSASLAGIDIIYSLLLPTLMY